MTYAMLTVAGPRSGDNVREAPSSSGSEPEPVDRGRSATVRWRPGVRLVLILVILLPMLSTGILAGSRLASGWTFRQRAQLVAHDAAQLRVIASARAMLNSMTLPLFVVSYAAEFGLSATDLDAILEPAVPFEEQLARESALMAGFPDFSSPKLRADVRELHAVSLQVAANTITYAEVSAFMDVMRLDIDTLWYQTYDKLLADISAWQVPGSFGLHASTVIQTYQAFLSGGSLAQWAALVLQGVGDSNSGAELIRADDVYRVATSQFAGNLSPRAQAVWDAMQADPANQQFEAAIQLAVTIAVTGGPAPFAGDATGAAVAMAPGIEYVTDLNELVVAVSQDLEDAALAQSADATRQFVNVLILLVVLAMVGLAGVIVAGRMLTRPLRKLASTARRVHDGDFDLDRLPATGPREIAATTRAFNEMASTLKAVEATTVALAAEDLSHPELFIRLPGRTGHALQATIDSLSARIREREQQRQLLHEAATHDQLTGLLNRAAVIDYLTNDVARRRQAGETVAVLFMDLDGLKQLNDTYGHDIGDVAVKATADAIIESTAICDVVGRLGGDEFLVVLCHDHSGDGDAVTERVNASLARHSLSVHDSVVPLRASVGVALARCDADTDPMTLVRQADAAMYIAKRTARATRDQLAASHHP